MLLTRDRRHSTDPLEAAGQPARGTPRFYGLETLGKGEIRRPRACLDLADFPSPQNFTAPLVLQLKGLSSKATISLNGQLLERWLSDTRWLQQGSWIRPQIGTLALEDTSSDKNPAGVINTLGLRYNREGSRWNGSGFTPVPGLRHRVTVDP